MPRTVKAPSDWPAVPRSRIVTVSGCSPAMPYLRVIIAANRVPTARWVFLTLYCSCIFSRWVNSGWASRIIWASSVSGTSLRPTTVQCTAPLPPSGRVSSGLRSRSSRVRAPRLTCLSKSERPTISSSERYPNCARSSRTSSATKLKRLTTFSGEPPNLARSLGSWVQTPTGQVLEWHCRTMMQPMAISEAVPMPYSSAPSRAAIITSRPVLMPPSVRSITFSRRRLRVST